MWLHKPCRISVSKAEMSASSWALSRAQRALAVKGRGPKRVACHLGMEKWQTEGYFM